MPTVLRVNGWRVVIYPNDHSPAHVHVVGPGWMVVVSLLDLTVREAIEADERTTRDVLRKVAGHQALLMDAWRWFHG